MTRGTTRTTFWPMVARGALRRCPRCGDRRAWFVGWFKMSPRCRACGYRYERQPGFSLGATTINTIVTFGALLAVLVVSAIAMYRTLPVVLLSVGLAIVVPILFYPFSYTIWAAIDLAMRPMEPEEIAEAEALVARNP